METIMGMTADREQESLVAALAARWQEDGIAVERYETHISRVVVAGPAAYKFKRPVRLNFLDFSTLAARERYCREELRLNRRLAPALYLDVIPVTGSGEGPALNGRGVVLDYAVRMKSFRQECLWSRRAELALLTAGEIDELADMLGRFHAAAPVAGPGVAWGSAATIRAVEEENRRYLVDHLPPGEEGGPAAVLRRERGQAQPLDTLFAERKREGHVRECHGDLHLANILTEDGHVQVFDCIEFNDAMRWIDVMSDIAFVRMDLKCHGLANLAARLLNRYLERTGDYGGLRVLDYYERQRAMVRAKIALVRTVQRQADRFRLPADAAAYLAFGTAARPRLPCIIILHGYSGCGKSTLAAALAASTDAVVLRSDVERKRLAGMAPADRGGAHCGDALYADEMTDRTYQRLLDLACEVVAAGYPAIVDASFLHGHRRDRFRELAARLDTPFLILDIRASERTMRERLARRALQGTDASDADQSVMSRQLAGHDALTPAETALSIPVGFDRDLDEGALRNLCSMLIPEIWKSAAR